MLAAHGLGRAILVSWCHTIAPWCGRLVEQRAPWPSVSMTTAAWISSVQHCTLHTGITTAAMLTMMALVAGVCGVGAPAPGASAGAGT